MTEKSDPSQQRNNSISVLSCLLQVSLRFDHPKSPLLEATCVVQQPAAFEIRGHHQDQQASETPRSCHRTRLYTGYKSRCLISLVHALFTLLTQSHPRNACPALVTAASWSQQRTRSPQRLLRHSSLLGRKIIN